MVGRPKGGQRSGLWGVPAWIPTAAVLLVAAFVVGSFLASLISPPDSAVDAAFPIASGEPAEPTPPPALAEPPGEPALPPLPAPANVAEAADFTEIRTMIAQFTQAVALEQQGIAHSLEAAIVARGRQSVPFIEWSMALNHGSPQVREGLARVKSAIEAQFPEAGTTPEAQGPPEPVR